MGLNDEVGVRDVGRCIIRPQANSQTDPDPAWERSSCRILPDRARLSLPEDLQRRKDSVLRITSRLIVSLIIGIGLVASLFTYSQVRGEKREMRAELEWRSELLAESLAQSVEPLLQKESLKELQGLVERFGNREHLAGIGVYDKEGQPLAMTTGLEARLRNRPPAALRATLQNRSEGEFITVANTPMHVYALPLRSDGQVIGALAIFHDTRFIDTQTAHLWRTTFLRLLVQILFIVLATLIIVRWSFKGPITKTAQWMRELRTGKGSESLGPNPPEADLFKPLTEEVTALAKSLEAARAAAEEEARLREAAEALWTPERLRIHIRGKLQERPLFIVSNREPYMHVHRGNDVDVIVPASGLVSALEPVMRACDGTWIANGSGDADREVVAEDARLRVPPDDPQYTLKRVWLTKEEEEGYYFGFSNEGLWPLCHIAHTRPTFRASDWTFYQQVNRKFADALVEEMEGSEHPGVLVQDYHFALLPRMIKDKRPDARVSIFWHIPWPNAEAFGICPWQRELVDGLLGADLVGFHIQSHCNNFLETVDRALESRIEWERFAVNRRGHITLVRPFPIGVAFAEGATLAGFDTGSIYLERAAMFKELGVEATFMGVGVDRVDYTKGILERFRGVERFLEKYPSFQGQFTFVQIGAPSRTHIKRYHDLLAEVESEADRINWRFQTGNWKPIVFLKRHHTHHEIAQYYRAADLCMVTSLHDGMNLVAKEFVASRDDEQGALILSRFTGASRELRDALVVNPYDTEQLAEAIRFALEMDPQERKTRMRRMRKVIRESNIYRWAANLISELSDIRLDRTERIHVR
jgi:alpha,alpha-trehalose-phosphate synthase [UDP-forming]